MSVQPKMWNDKTALETLIENVGKTMGVPADSSCIRGVMIAGPWQESGVSGIKDLDTGWYTGSIPWGAETGQIACQLLQYASKTHDETLMMHASFALQAWAEWQMEKGTP